MPGEGRGTPSSSPFGLRSWSSPRGRLPVAIPDEMGNLSRMIRSAIAILLGATLIAGCASPAGNDLGRMAERPAFFVGQRVRVCGFVTNGHEDHGIWRSKAAWARQDRPMLGLTPLPSRGHYDEPACISGQIVRTGCGEEMICLDIGGEVPFALREEPAG